MGKHFALTLKLPAYRDDQKKRKLRQVQKPDAINKFAGIIVAIFCALALLNYIFRVNSVATKGYEINRLQTNLAQLKEQQKKLHLEMAQLQSIQRIQTDPATSGMVPVKDVAYIQNHALTKK